MSSSDNQLALLVVAGADRGARLEVGPRASVVGRARDVDLVLTDPGVSRRHLEVLQAGEKVEVRVVAGAAPFLVGEMPMEHAELRRGERILVGNTLLEVASAPEDTPPDAAAGDRTDLRVLLGGAATEVRGLAALFALSQAIDEADDLPSITRALRAWAAQHAHAADASLLVGPDLDGTPPTDPGAGKLVERPTPDPGGTLVRVPAGAVPHAGIEFRLRMPPHQVTDALRRLLVVAGAVCASSLARQRAFDSMVKNSQALRQLAVGSARVFLGDSAAATQIAGVIPRLAASDALVLLLGETGAGKSFVARLIHESSARSREPLRIINCAAIPETLVEAELFGHERGAFSGASSARAGAFEAAGRGTLLLDEIAELPPTSQAKLLRVLEERRFERIGSNRIIPLEARVLAATNRDLQAMVQEGAFRRDLFFRISVVTVRLPALRDRGDDVVLLARHILRDLAASAGRRVSDFSPAALDVIRAYPWPGNVRELRNAIEHAIVLGEGPSIEPSDFPPGLEAPVPVCPTPVAPGAGPDLPTRLDELEWLAIDAALAKTGGNRTRAAALLGIDRVTLYHKLKKRER
jgi:DNA-binding NtrC family response regulator